MHEESAVTFECGKRKQVLKQKTPGKITRKIARTHNRLPRKREKLLKYATRPPQNQISQDIENCYERSNIGRKGTKNNETGISETENRKIEPQKYKPAYAECPYCGRKGTKNNETGISETENRKLEPQKYQPAYAECPYCGQQRSKTNMARHQKP